MKNQQLNFHFSLSCTGEGNGTPLQRSCLEDPRDGRAWWAAIYGVAQSRTRLKRLSRGSSRRNQHFQEARSAHPVIPISSVNPPCCDCCLVAKSCSTLCNPMDCSPPGPSMHGTSQARILERVAISFFTFCNFLYLCEWETVIPFKVRGLKMGYPVYFRL